ncbi:MAG: S8 family serine peptidase, partial [Caldilineaceae bacterium]|nr:S8 family serine peptidase [Caldilineaceae bacterium]
MIVQRAVLKLGSWLRWMLVASLLLGLSSSGPASASDMTTRSVIIQAGSADDAQLLVRRAGGTVTHSLPVINAVGARLTMEQLDWLRASAPSARVYADHQVEIAGPLIPDSIYPTLIGAGQLHLSGITGRGIGVAVIDTGTWNAASLLVNTLGILRIPARYDAIANTMVLPSANDDGYGHGTHMASIIADSAGEPAIRYNGVAPDV